MKNHTRKTDPKSWMITEIGNNHYSVMNITVRLLYLSNNPWESLGIRAIGSSPSHTVNGWNFNHQNMVDCFTNMNVVPLLKLPWFYVLRSFSGSNGATMPMWPMCQSQTLKTKDNPWWSRILRKKMLEKKPSKIGLVDGGWWRWLFTTWDSHGIVAPPQQSGG